VADLDAPESQHLLDHPKAQGKAKVQPDGVADQLRGEALAGVGDLGRTRYGRLIAGSPCSGNPTHRQFDGAPNRVDAASKTHGDRGSDSDEALGRAGQLFIGGSSVSKKSILYNSAE
jgi:hypothetical protein